MKLYSKTPLSLIFLCVFSQQLAPSHSLPWFKEIIGGVAGGISDGASGLINTVDTVVKTILVFPVDIVRELGAGLGVFETVQQMSEKIEADAQRVRAKLEKIEQENTTMVWRDPNRVRFYLYTNQANDSERVELVYNSSVEDIRNSGFNSSLPVVLIAHGFMGDTVSSDSSATYLKLGYFKAGYVGSAANVILVDWSKMSGPTVPTVLDYLGILYQYVKAAMNVEVASRRVADFLIFLKSQGLLLNGGSSVTLVCHSLGTHVCGMAAKNYNTANEDTKDVISTLIGSDPAGPLFQYVPKDKRFDKSDASFVVAIHSNQYMFGYIDSLADVDFYVNGGGPIQPQCLNPLSSAAKIPGCSHQLGPKFFQRFLADSKPVVGYCFAPTRAGSCSDRKIGFGAELPRSTTGPYVVHIKENI